MANYVKATNFAVKDSLASGNPAKIVKGTEIDTEFNAIASAIASKLEGDSPTLTGTPLAPTATTATNNTQIASTAYVVNRIAQDIAGKANIASPTFTGTPAAPTAATATETTQLATTAYVAAKITDRFNNPALTGTPTTPTASAGTNTTQIASTAFVVAERTNAATLTNKTLTLSSNTVSGTKSEFNTAVTDTDFTFLNDFTGASNQSFTSNGYQKLPGGLILQWGTIAPSSRSSEHDFGNISYPIAFPTAALNVTATVYTNETPASTDSWAAIKSFSRTSFNPYLGSAIVNTQNNGITWFAIGY